MTVSLRYETVPQYWDQSDPNASAGDATLTARQALFADNNLIQWQSSLKFQPWRMMWQWDQASPVQVGMTWSADQVTIPWNLQMGWRWNMPQRQSTVATTTTAAYPIFGWSFRINPPPFRKIFFLGDDHGRQRLQFHAFAQGVRGLVTTVTWKQELQNDDSKKDQHQQGGTNGSAGSSNSLDKKPNKSEKALELGIKTQWLSRRTDILIFWTDQDFQFRIPIALLPNVDNLATCILQNLFLSCWSKICLDGLTDCFNLQQQVEKVQSLAQQQDQLQYQKAREDALKQQHLMERQAKSRREAEGEVGLVIEKAIYGVLEFGTPHQEEAKDELGNTPDNGSNHKETLDVTTALQFWVSQGKLELPGSSKQDLLGFCDPRSLGNNQQDEEASAKQSPWHQWWEGLFHTLDNSDGSLSNQDRPPLELYIRYRTGGFSYHITVQDQHAVILPSPRALQLDGGTHTLSQQ